MANDKLLTDKELYDEVFTLHSERMNKDPNLQWDRSSLADVYIEVCTKKSNSYTRDLQKIYDHIDQYHEKLNKEKSAKLTEKTPIQSVSKDPSSFFPKPKKAYQSQSDDYLCLPCNIL